MCVWCSEGQHTLRRLPSSAWEPLKDFFCFPLLMLNTLPDEIPLRLYVQFIGRDKNVTACYKTSTGAEHSCESMCAWIHLMFLSWQPTAAYLQVGSTSRSWRVLFLTTWRVRLNCTPLKVCVCGQKKTNKSQANVRHFTIQWLKVQFVIFKNIYNPRIL